MRPHALPLAEASLRSRDFAGRRGKEVKLKREFSRSQQTERSLSGGEVPAVTPPQARQALKVSEKLISVAPRKTSPVVAREKHQYPMGLRQAADLDAREIIVPLEAVENARARFLRPCRCGLGLLYRA